MTGFIPFNYLPQHTQPELIYLYKEKTRPLFNAEKRKTILLNNKNGIIIGVAKKARTSGILGRLIEYTMGISFKVHFSIFKLIKCR